MTELRPRRPQCLLPRPATPVSRGRGAHHRRPTTTSSSSSRPTRRRGDSRRPRRCRGAAPRRLCPRTGGRTRSRHRAGRLLVLDHQTLPHPPRLDHVRLRRRRLHDPPPSPCRESELRSFRFLPPADLESVLNPLASLPGMRSPPRPPRRHPHRRPHWCRCWRARKPPW